MTGRTRQLYRRLVYGEAVVVVSGLPRSGTSMAMKMLEAGGVELVTDGARSADIDNPKGYFEDDRVLDLAKSEDKTWLRDARGKAVKIISYLLRHLPPDNNYRVLFMRRDIGEVLASQAKMLARRGEQQGADDDAMRELFEADLWRANYHLKRAPHIQALDLHYRHVLEDPVPHARRIAEFLGRDLDLEAMAAIVDPELYRNRA
ncbi:MAG: sulfotransferase [Acidobacteriota bacterium]|nr:sulfotransferase [Acidobacteriota bacterium]MDH3523960.1 sulfotransferase [Acidobacteriota bacterium]